MNMFARWLFRRIVGPRVIKFMWIDDYGQPWAIDPAEVEVVFRGR